MADFPLDLFVDLIPIANDLTSGLQSTIQHYAFLGQDGGGNETYADPVPLSAIVDYTNRQLIRDGQFIMVGATLTIIGDVLPNGSTSADPPRREPIDPRDKIVLPDGTSAPILEVPNSVANPETNRGLIHVIKLGARS